MELYDKVYEVYEGFWRGPAETYSHYKLKQTLLYLIKSEPRLNNRSILLDVGCGIGTDLNMLSVSGIEGEFLGLDISFVAIKKANELTKRRGKQNFYWIVASAEHLPIRDDIIDIIISSEVAEHLQNPLAFLSETKRVLKKGGVLVLTTPNPDYLLGKIARLLPRKVKDMLNEEQQWHLKRISPELSTFEWEKGHISIMSLKSWEKLIERAGLKIDKIRGSAIFGGHAWLDKHSLVLGIIIVLDSLVSVLVGFSKRLHFNLLIKCRKVS
jgi:ubiquinone/menaquinone biosynthesis C-methylase UbiE